jgi:hypothetical protein
VRKRRILTPVLALMACALFALPAIGLAAKKAHHPAKPQRISHSASTRKPSFSTGFSSNYAGMFISPLFAPLHTTIARYIAPYDAATNATDTALFKAWATTAKAAHVTMLVAFYHSEGTPARFHVPSLNTYKADVKKFIAMAKPYGVKEYQPWDEVNRGTLSGAGGFVSPNPTQSAQFYQALIGLCRGCTLVGLDVLDNPNYHPTISFIHSFESELRKLHVSYPHIWGLHNYSDVNSYSSTRTRGILAALPRGAEVWLTETGGIVTLASRHYGDVGAAKATAFTFHVASEFKQIKRVYIYTWQAAIPPNTRFDSGVLDLATAPRPAYITICKQLLGSSSAYCAAESKHVDSTH